MGAVSPTRSPIPFCFVKNKLKQIKTKLHRIDHPRKKEREEERKDGGVKLPLRAAAGGLVYFLVFCFLTLRERGYL